MKLVVLIMDPDLVKNCTSTLPQLLLVRNWQNKLFVEMAVVQTIAAEDWATEPPLLLAEFLEETFIGAIGEIGRWMCRPKRQMHIIERFVFHEILDVPSLLYV